MPAVVAVSDTCLPEVGDDRVELPPSDGYPVRVSGIDRDGRLVSCVIDYVVTRPVHVDLDARIGPVGDDAGR